MKKKKGDTIKVYAIERTNQYGSVFACSLVSNGWVYQIHQADLYNNLQECKNNASILIEKSIERNRKYPDAFPLVDDITVRELEIKFLN